MISNLLSLILDHKEDDFISYVPQKQDEYLELDPSGQTLLMNAILEKQSRIIDFLLKIPVLLEKQSRRRGWSPLHYCAFMEDIATASKLLKKDVKVDIKDSFGNTPLWTAVFEAKGHKYSIVEFFVKQGANSKIKNKNDTSPLDFAKKIGDTRLIEILSLASTNSDN